jgi:hypothetical protein
MKKYMLTILIMLSLVSLIFTLSYAWFTHTQSHQVMKLISKDIDITTTANNQIVVETIVIDDLVMIDFQNDFVLNTYQVRKDTASILEIQILLSMDSMQSKHFISFTPSSSDVIYILYADLLNLNQNGFDKNQIDGMVDNLIGIETDSQVVQSLITLHNESLLNDLKDIIIKPGETIIFYVVLWAKDSYNQEVDSNLLMTIETISFVGGPS